MKYKNQSKNDPYFSPQPKEPIGYAPVTAGNPEKVVRKTNAEYKEKALKMAADSDLEATQILRDVLTTGGNAVAAAEQVRKLRDAARAFRAFAAEFN